MFPSRQHVLADSALGLGKRDVAHRRRFNGMQHVGAHLGKALQHAVQRSVAMDVHQAACIMDDPGDALHRVDDPGLEVRGWHERR